MMIRLFYLFFYIIEGITYLQYCSAIFECTRSKMQKYFSIIILYTALFLISFFYNPLVNIFSCVIANFLFLFNIYHPKWYISLFHSIFSTAIMVLSELVFIIISPNQISYSFSEWSEFQIWIIPFVCSKILYFFILQLVAHVFSTQKYKRQEGHRPIILLAIVPSITIFVSFTFLHLSKSYALSPLFAKLISLSTLFLFSLNVIIWGNYKNILEKSSEMMNLQLLLQKESDAIEYYKMLIQQIENQSQFVHDTKNHLQSILLLNEKGDKEKVSAYIKSLISSSAMQTSSRICNNEFLNALLCRYSAQCRELDISFRADIRNNVCNFLKEEDITSLFCNLLDNAIESASQMQDSFLELSISERAGTNFTIITLTNSCRKNPFSGHKKILKTTKSDVKHHGYGMKIIEKVVKRYHGEMQAYYSEDSYTFHTIITLKSLDSSH